MLTKRSVIRLLRDVHLGLGVALALTCGLAQATDRSWNNPSGGSFHSSGNWSPAGVPGSSDGASFALSPTYTVSFFGNVTNTHLYQRDGNVTFDLGSRTYTLSAYAHLAESAGDSSQLTVTNGTVSLWRTYLAEAATANGVLTISTGANWNNSDVSYVGYEGTGTLNIYNGGVVTDTYGILGEYSGSSGAATVDGAGSTWTNSTSVYVGHRGAGALTIQNDGAVTSHTGSLGRFSGSSGTVTVDGIGSSWDTSDYFYVGAQGTGDLTIQNGGAVSNLASFVGDSPGSSGAVTVDGVGSTWTNSNSLSVGPEGTGALTIQNGGAATNSTAVLGALSGGSGTVTVDGVGSTWTNTSGSSSSTIGQAGAGVLTIKNGGSAVFNRSLNVGSSSGSNGTVTVDGPGSTLAIAGELSNGPGGTGDVTIQNGGTVSSSHGFLGYYSTGSGTVIVDGAGSSWTNSEYLRVGSSGAGVLTIQNGGAVSNTDGSLAHSPGSTGAATVDGTGSTWTNSSYLIISNWGPATLTIQNGGAVSNTNGYVAVRSGSTGAVTVDGNDSTWSNTGSLYIGGRATSAGGTGTLDVSNLGSVNVTDTMKIWSTGSVEVTGGTISAGAIENAGTLLNNGTVSGNVLNQSGGTLSGSGTFQDTVTIADGSTVSPGASPGTMTWGSGVLEGGGSLLWEINDATGSAGANWDLLSVDNTLSITATALDPFVIDIDSLLPDSNPGLLDNFSNTGSYQWTILTAAGGITGFSPDYFQLDDSGFQNDLGGEDFYLTLAGNNLNLNFGTAVPEPSTFVLWGTGAITLLLFRRRRCKQRA